MKFLYILTYDPEYKNDLLVFGGNSNFVMESFK